MPRGEQWLQIGPVFRSYSRGSIELGRNVGGLVARWKRDIRLPVFIRYSEIESRVNKARLQTLFLWETQSRAFVCRVTRQMTVKINCHFPTRLRDISNGRNFSPLGETNELIARVIDSSSLFLSAVTVLSLSPMYTSYKLFCNLLVGNRIRHSCRDYIAIYKVKKFLKRVRLRVYI